MTRLKAALIGLQGAGLEYLAAIQADEQFELAAVADEQAQIVSQYTEGTDMTGYTDFRSLIVEVGRCGLDFLLVALEPFQSIEFVELAAQRGISVFHKAPFARNVAEASALKRSFEQNGCALVVARSWESRLLKTRLETLTDSIGQLFWASASVHTRDGSAGWRGDSERAGGGVLLNGAYEFIDLLVRLFGLPETVYGQCNLSVARGVVPNYDTEDAASVSLRFSEGRSATLSARRGAVVPSWQVEIAGTEGEAQLSAEGIAIRDRQGKAHERCRVAPHEPLSSQIRALAQVQHSPDLSFESTVDEHFGPIAVIEAAYLSAKTGTPEPPSQFLELSGSSR